MADEIQRWRQGHLWLLENCGERYRREVEEKEIAPSPIRFARGSSVHYVIAEAHKKQMSDRGDWDGDVPSAFENAPGTYASVKEAGDLAATKFDERQRAGVAFSKDETSEGVANVAGRQKDSAVKLAELYVSKVAPRIFPLGVERRIVVRPKDLPIEVSGTIDVIEGLIPALVGPDGPVLQEAIVDDKTGERSPNKNAADQSSQLTMYALVRYAEIGRLPSKVSLIHLVRTKTGAISAVRQDSKRTMADLHALSSRLTRAIESVKKGVFMPNTKWWGCSSKWCPFWETCVFPEGKDRDRAEQNAST